MSKSEKLLILMVIPIFLASMVYLGMRITNEYHAYQAHQQQVLEKEAQAMCMAFGIPQAIVIEGQAFCWFVSDGTDQVVPLEGFEQPNSEYSPFSPSS